MIVRGEYKPKSKRWLGLNLQFKGGFEFFDQTGSVQGSILSSVASLMKKLTLTYGVLFIRQRRKIFHQHPMGEDVPITNFP
jgi:hypothetical protein